MGTAATSWPTDRPETPEAKAATVPEISIPGTKGVFGVLG
jgi:hypothetical protein